MPYSFKFHLYVYSFSCYPKKQYSGLTSGDPRLFGKIESPDQKQIWGGEAKCQKVRLLDTKSLCTFECLTWCLTFVLPKVRHQIEAYPRVSNFFFFFLLMHLFVTKNGIAL